MCNFVKLKYNQLKNVFFQYIVTLTSLIFLFYTLSLDSKVVGMYYKLLIFILIGLIISNVIFYESIIKIIRRTQIKKINIFMGITVIGLLLLNRESTYAIGFYLENSILHFYNSGIRLYKVYEILLWFYILLEIYFIFRNIEIKKLKVEEGEENHKDKYLLSFREEELKKIIELVEDKGIPSILIDAKMGNGKTRLIDNFIDSCSSSDVIYYKLPLVKDLEEFKINLFNEIKRIFLKYDIENTFLNDFFNKVSIFKTSFFEIGINKKSNNWENIKKLKEGLKKIDNYTNVVIILDDIEREDDPQKTKDIVVFLGELSEYFKDTTVTILFLAEYESLKNQFSKNESGLEKKLEKYIRYQIKLKEPKISELSLKDMGKIFDELLEKNPNNTITEEDKKITIEIVDIFFKALEAKKTNENFRNLTRSFNKMILLNNKIITNRYLYIIFIFTTLSDIFFLKEKIEKEDIEYEKIVEYERAEYKKIKNNFYPQSLQLIGLITHFSVFDYEISKIEEIYSRNEFLNDKIKNDVDIMIDILDGKKKNSDVQTTFLDERLVFDYIGIDKEKFIIAVDRGLLENKNLIANKLLEIEEEIEFNFSTKEKIEKILLYPERDHERDHEYEREEEIERLDEENEVIDYESIYRTKSQERNQQLLEKLKRLNVSDEKLKEIENVLNQDIETEARNRMYSEEIEKEYNRRNCPEYM